MQRDGAAIRVDCYAGRLPFFLGTETGSSGPVSPALEHVSANAAMKSSSLCRRKWPTLLLNLGHSDFVPITLQ
jgi:hypothetical protein